MLAQEWSEESVGRWQDFYDTAPRVLIYGGAQSLIFQNLSKLPEYEDFKPVECKKIIFSSAATLNAFSFSMSVTALFMFFSR